jgi:hypothetical protein
MLMETGGDGVRFKPRLVEGVDAPEYERPEQLILDGQQRLTSLFMAIQSGKPVPTRTSKGEDIKRFYFLDMALCLDPDAERIDAVVSVPENRMVTSDFGRKVELDVSTREKEYEACLFPLSLVFAPTEFTEWKMGFQEYHGFDPAKSRFLMQFENDVWLRFQQYKIPVIKILKDTPKEAVCQVFEKVNTGGVTLSVFELVTATFAADDFSLREDWEEKERALCEYDVLKDFDATSFLTAVTLLASFQRHLQWGGAVSCKRRDVLNLSLEDYRRLADSIVQGLKDAARLLAGEKIFDARSLPYTTQLIPLSAICAHLGKRFEEVPVKQKIKRWYWSGVLGELYGGANESRFAMDMQDVVGWIEGGEEPRTIRDANFNPVRLLSLQTRNSAAYKGIYALLMQQGSRDFLNGDPVELTTYFDRAIDIHHVFPRAYCERLGLKRSKWNSIVNKAPLSASTNRMIGGRAPSSYLRKFEEEKQLDSLDLNEILASHLINPADLYGDRFDEFIINRASRLLDCIESAMGKAAAGRDSEEVVNAFGGSLAL